MTDANPIIGQIPADINDMSKYAWFAYVCDGEVGDIIMMPLTMERRVAVHKSNPIIVQITPEQQVMMGDIYENGTFSRPPITGE